MENEIIKDFGSWSIPRGWGDLTLLQYQNLERLYTSDEKFDFRGIIEALGEHNRSEIDSLPIEFAESLLSHLNWLYESPNFGEPTNKVEISGETYQVNIQNKLKVGEYVAVDSLIKQDRHNYAAIMAILCRKPDEIYDSKFENELLEDRIKMWEQVPVMKVIPIVNFFLQCWMLSEIPTLLSSQLLEGINHIRENIMISNQNGELSGRSTKRLMKKLTKLEKSINSI